MYRRVVVTGLGAVTPLGNDAPSFWNAIKAGRNGISLISAFDTSNRKAHLAAQVYINPIDFIPPADAKRMDRFSQFAFIAGSQALSDSLLSLQNTPPERCGILIASGIGGIASIEREQMRGSDKGFDRVSPFFIPMAIANMAAGHLAILSGFQGYAAALVTACAGASNAIGEALRLIRHGYLDAILCGGSEASITPLTVGGFTSMKALSESSDINRASIPFDRDRNGFVLGEGAAMLMLESLDNALARNASIYAELSGYGASCDAFHMTAPHPDAVGAVNAMRSALADANLATSDINYINAHGTSTPLNDKCEALAINQLFTSPVKVSSTKSMTGHLLGAAGAVEAIVCIKAIQDSFLPPNINFLYPDPDCDLDIVANLGQYSLINHAMSNSFGFGGHNASLIFSRYRS